MITSFIAPLLDRPSLPEPAPTVVRSADRVDWTAPCPCGHEATFSAVRDDIYSLRVDCPACKPFLPAQRTPMEGQ